jgi:methyltransferase (TIGR00027 family)
MTSQEPAQPPELRQGDVASTALTSALLRAAHLVLDHEPKIFADDLAMRLAGCENDAELRHIIQQRMHVLRDALGSDLAQEVFNRLRAIMIVRARFAEDELARAIETGIRQYVILGAGLDSFAYRRRDLATRIRIFEVDHPRMLEWKSSRLADSGIPIPGNVAFAPVDLESGSLRESLQTTGFQETRPAFFSWLGVTQYLLPSATAATLEQIGSCTPGTQVALEYLLPHDLLIGVEHQFLTYLTEAGASRGVHWHGLYAPSKMTAWLQAFGFSGVRDLDAESLNSLYFNNRRDGLRVPAASHLLTATVA